MTTTTNTADIADRYRRLAADLTRRIEAVAPADWDNPSPCEGWTAREVLGHVVDTETQSVGVVGLSLPPAPAVQDDPLAAWTSTRDAMQEILDDPDRAGLEYEGSFGRTNLAATIGSFYCFDLVIHGWDIAHATGTDETIEPESLAMVRAFADQMGDNIRMEGVCGPAVEAPEDADDQTKFLAFLGRRS